jgi:sortase A
LNSYFVAPDQPKLLKISQLNVNARIRRMGIKANSQLEAPGNIYDAGWYEDSSKPGDGLGATLIDGHVSGPTKTGIFYNLKKLNPGNEINIIRGDGQQFTYVVADKKSYPIDKVDMAATLKSANPTKPGLNLITCSGKFDTKSQQYQERLVVFAVAR